MTPLLAKPAQFVGRPLAPALPRAQSSATSFAIPFLFFLLLTFVLFVRPTEWITDPDILGFELYQAVIVVCLALSYPILIEQTRLRKLEHRPITLCVLLFGLAIVLSHLAQFRLSATYAHAYDYIKTAAYFLLFTGLVSTPTRLRHLVTTVLLSATVVATVALLQYFEFINLPTITALKDNGGTDAMTGRIEAIQRLRGTGIFHDPNDVCVLFAMAIPLLLYRLTDKTAGTFRLFWLFPLLVLLTAIYFTYSRGGFLSMLVGIGVMLVLRYGWRLGAFLVIMALPVLLLLGGARQTSFETGSGTAKDRIWLWSEGLVQFKTSPLFGIGCGRYAEVAGQVAHNSYLHAFTETGIIGGTFFLSLFALTLRQFWRRRPTAGTIADPTMRRMVPFLGGAVAAYCMGMMSLTLTYIGPTLMIAAIGDVLPRLASMSPAQEPDRFDTRLTLRMFLLGGGFLVVMYGFVRFSLGGG